MRRWLEAATPGQKGQTRGPALARVAEQSVTNINGDGGEHSHAEKRRVEGHIVVKAPTEID